MKPFLVFESELVDDELDLSTLSLGEYLSSARDSPFFDRGVLRQMMKAVDVASERTTKDIGDLDRKDIMEAKAAFAKVSDTVYRVSSLSSCDTGFGVVLRSDGT